MSDTENFPYGFEFTPPRYDRTYFEAMEILDVIMKNGLDLPSLTDAQDVPYEGML